MGPALPRVPGAGIIWEMGPSMGREAGSTQMGNWDGELGLPRHQHHQLGPGNSHWDLPGTSTWTSIALALDTGTKSHWLCLGPGRSTGNWANWSTSTSWALPTRATQAPGSWGALGHHHRGCGGESSGVAGFGCGGDIPQSGMMWGRITGVEGDMLSSPRPKLFPFSVLQEGNRGTGEGCWLTAN